MIPVCNPITTESENDIIAKGIQKLLSERSTLRDWCPSGNVDAGLTGKKAISKELVNEKYIPPLAKYDSDEEQP